MQQIGKGAFSTVYKKSNTRVLIKSRDHVKECMSLGWFPSSKIFPSLKRVGSSECGKYTYYEQKYYPKVKSLKNSLKPFEYEFYIVLREVSSKSFGGFYELHGEFQTIPKKFSRRVAVLREALDALSNYGLDIGFEISPRNVAVNNGCLVLLDCFFFKSQLVR